MAQRGRNGRRRKRLGNSGITKNFQAGIILVVAVLLLGGFMANYFIATQEAGHISKAFCRTDTLPEITAVVIDHTDRISTIQRASLESRLWSVANAIEKNGAIRLYSVQGVQDSPLEPGVDLCNPGNPKDVRKWDGNERIARKHYEEKFGTIIKSKLEGILTAETAPQSPIMKSVQSVVVTSFIGDTNKAGKKKLVLVSDLLEHSDAFSLYRGIPDFNTYRNGPHWPSVKSDMRGIDVEIFYLNRTGAEKLQTPRLKTFWQLYFMEQGASSVKFVPIEG